MTAFIINNQNKQLNGSVNISGAKNSAIPIILSSLLINGKTILNNIPLVDDVKNSVSLIEELGAVVNQKNNKLTILPKIKSSSHLNSALKIRSSILLMGIFFAKNLELKLPLPGGCRFGPRPIDIHINSLKELGADIELKKDCVILKKRKNNLKNKTITLRLPSVSATLNIILASVMLSQETIIKNPAKEPEVQDLCNFLNACGANISGIGSDTLTINRVNNLNPSNYTIIPDRIEASTFILAAILTNSEITITNINPSHLQALLELIKKIGTNFDIKNSSIIIHKHTSLNSFDIETDSYPGIPTDLQPLLTVLGIKIGNCSITEKVYGQRFTHLDELKKLGADLFLKGNNLTLNKSSLSGNSLSAPDIRAGASLLLASLISKGKTKIFNIEQIDRGYERIDDKLKKLGVDIKRSPS